MTLKEALIQLKAFARIDGVWLAALWAASFAFVLLAPASSLGTMLTMCTPFLAGARLVSFRNRVLDGKLSFRRGLAYTWYMFFYASILFAAIQFVYFQFLDHGHFTSLIYQSGDVLTAVYKAEGLDTREIKDAIAMLTELRPIEFTLLFMSQNLLIGTMLSIPIALVCRRSVPFRHPR